MVVSVVCDGVRVRVHVYRTEVVMKSRVLKSSTPLEALDAGQRVGPGGGGAHGDHGAGWAGRTCGTGRTGGHLGWRMVMVATVVSTTMISTMVATMVLPVTIVKHGG